MATISDQGTANVSAIKILNEETRSYCIKNELPYDDQFYEIELVNNERLKLVHIYDVPHLIKCIRNNFITKNLVFTINNDVKCAKWSHLVDIYNEDNAIPDCKMLPRLTDQHIIPDKILKMKVKNAFTTAYKTLVLNNLVSSHSPGSNCEEDFTDGSFVSFKNLFIISKKPCPPSDKIIAADLPLTIHQLPNPTSYLREQTHSYIAGFITYKKIK